MSERKNLQTLRTNLQGGRAIDMIQYSEQLADPSDKKLWSVAQRSQLL